MGGWCQSNRNAHGKITLETFPAFAPEGIEYTNHYDYGIVGSAMWVLSV